MNNDTPYLTKAKKIKTVKTISGRLGLIVMMKWAIRGMKRLCVTLVILFPFLPRTYSRTIPILKIGVSADTKINLIPYFLFHHAAGCCCRGDKIA